MKSKPIIPAKSLIKFLLVSLRMLFIITFFQGFLFFIGQIVPSTFDEQNPYISLPIVFKTMNGGDLSMPNSDEVAKFDIWNATGVIITNGLPKKALYTASIGIIVHISCILLMISLICKILESARNGNFLLAKNAIRLRHIALLGIVLLLLDKVFTIISSSYLSNKLEFPGIEFNSFNYYSYAEWKYIFLYLFLLIIAEAFRLGAQIKQENDLTI